MKTCPVCNKRLGIFKTGILYRYGNLRFCSIKCKKEYANSEIKCTCNKCGKVWYYQPKEKRMQDVGKLGLSFTFLWPLKSGERPLDACPNCFSKDVKKEIVRKNR